MSNILFVILLFISNFISVFSDTECPIVYFKEDRRKDKNTLRLMQYNVEWLFIDYYSAMDCPGNGCTWSTIEEAETHMFYVSNVINTLKPDIINFCEVEGCDELNMLVSLLDSSYISYLKKGTDTGTGQNVGMLTKIDPLVNLYRSEEKVEYPIINSQCGETSKTGNTGVSKHYITEFKIASMDVAMIGIHLLAIPTEPSRCVQREAQAQIIQNIVFEYIKAGYEIIVIGDMNDYDKEVLDINSDFPTSRVLDILKGIDGENEGTYTLLNAASLIPQNERYSDWWDADNNCATTSQNEVSMIDHILVTPNIYNKINDVFIYHEYDEYCGKLDSDHWPVIIDIDTSE